MSTTRSLFWLTLSEIIFNLSGYIIHAGVGRILGPEGYGRYALVITITTMLIILIGNGIPTAMAKYISEVQDTEKARIQSIKAHAIRLQLLLMMIVTMIFFFLAPSFSLLLGDPTLTPLFRLATLIIPSFAAASFYFYYFNGLKRYRTQAFLKTIRSVARVLFIILLAYYFGIEGTIAGYIIAPFIVFLFAYAIDKFIVSKDFRAHYQKNDFQWRKLIYFAWPMTLFLLFYELMISIDLYLVKALLHSDALAGIYNAALTIGRIPYFLFYALTIVLLPAISHSTANHDVGRTKNIITQALRLQFLLLFPVVALMSVFAKPLITFFYGQEYSAASTPLIILTFGAAFLTVFYVLSFALSGAGKVKIPMVFAFLGLMLNAVLSFVLIPHFGLQGAASATTFSSLIVMGMILIATYKYFHVTISFVSLLRIFIATILMYAVALFFPQSNNLFILWGMLLFVFYLSLLSVFRELTKEDFALVRNLLAQRK